MMIRSETGKNDGYTMRMISGNKIPGLLGVQEKWLDGVSMFYYDITSKQPLSRLAERRKMTGFEIRMLLSDLILVLRQMERFLLDEQRICLRPEYIYIEPETYHGNFCIIPGYCSDFPKEFLDFAQYILDHADHSDGEAVILAFSVFRESRKENFGVEDIEKCLGKENNSKNSVEPSVEGFAEYQAEEGPGIPEREIDLQIIQNEEVDGRISQRIFYLFILAGMIAIPLICIGVFGINFLFRWKWALLAIEILLAAVGLFIFGFVNNENEYGTRQEKTTETELGELIWEMTEEIEGKKTGPSANTLDLESDDEMQTVLLISQTDLCEKRKLLSLSERREIPINYFPFLIGKNKGLVDFCLNEPGVSRLHAKLEKEGKEYYITDLNSTNGTKINGQLLEANEKRQLRIGDELEFAGSLFRFQ